MASALLVLLACLTPHADRVAPTLTPPRGACPAVGVGADIGEGCVAVVGSLALFRERGEQGCEDEGDDAHPVQIRTAPAAAPFDPAVGPSATFLPAFDVVKRSLYLLCGRLTC